MMGFGGWTAEMWALYAERMAVRDKRVDAMVAESGGAMMQAEAYMRVTCEMEHEEWQAAEQRKLDDIRVNGT